MNHSYTLTHSHALHTGRIQTERKRERERESGVISKSTSKKQEGGGGGGCVMLLPYYARETHH